MRDRADKVYLGDAVYADCDFGQIYLTTGGDEIVAANMIVLERGVYEALVAYAERLKKEGKL